MAYDDVSRDCYYKNQKFKKIFQRHGPVGNKYLKLFGDLSQQELGCLSKFDSYLQQKAVTL